MNDDYHCPRCRELSTKLTTLTLLAGRADICTPAERAVLDAMRAVAKDELLLMAQGVWCGHGQEAAVAELARREAAK